MWFAIAVVRNAFQIGWFVSERNEEREKEGKEFGWRTKIRFINRMGIGNGLKSRIIKQQQQWSGNKDNGKTKRKAKNYFVDVINTSNANANAAQCEWIRAAFWYFYGYGWLVGWLVSVYAFFVPFYSCLFCFFWFLLFDAKSHAIELGLCILLCAMLLLSKTKDLIQHTNNTISFNTLCDILFVWAIQVFGWILVLMLWF